MTSESLFLLFKNISVRKVNGRYSLYKPLVLLYALSKVSSEENRLIFYKNIDENLNKIIAEYSIKLIHKNFNYAFGRLVNDNLWEVENIQNLKLSSSGDLEKSELFKKNIRGGFSEDVYKALLNDKKISQEIYNYLENTYFKTTINFNFFPSIKESKQHKGKKMALMNNEGEPVSRWWVHKGIDTIRTDREIFSSSNMRRARLEFIAGKNRLGTIKGWMLAAQIIKNGRNAREFELTDFGFSLFENDPKLEKSSSWWAFHLSVCFSEVNEPYASFFTNLDYLSKDWTTEKQIIRKTIEQIKKDNGEDYTEKTMDSLLGSVRKMFVNDHPLSELGLIETRKNHEQGISIRLGTPKLTDEIIIHALAMMRFHHYKSRSSIDFSELLSAGLGHYLCCSPEQLRSHLRRLNQNHHCKNYFGFNEAVNIDSISFGEGCDPRKTLLELLQKGDDTWL